MARRFRVAARQPGATKSALVNEALRRFFNPTPEGAPSDEVLRRLTGLAKRLREMHRELQVTTETLALFARYVLAVTPPPPEEERQVVGRKRYDVLIREVGRRIASDHTLVSEVIHSFAFTHPELVARAAAEAAVADAGTKPLPFGAATSPTREGLGHG